MKSLLSITLLFCMLFTFASTKDEEKIAKVSIPVTEDQEIILDMKNTEVYIESWNKNEVYVEAIVRLDDNLTEKRKEFLDAWQQIVEDKISVNGPNIIISSGLSETKEVNSKSLFGMTIYTSITFDEKFDIIYYIKAPKNNPYEITGSYKNISMTGDYETVDLKLYSADLEVDNISKANFNLKYGTAEFNSIEELETEIYEQKLKGVHIGTLDISTKYSKVEIDKVGNLDGDSYESDFKMEFLENLQGNFKYGDIEVSQKMNAVKLELYEVDMEFNEVNEIILNSSKYSSLKAETVQTLDLIYSYEDEFDIASVGSVESTETKYGKYELEVVSDRVLLNGYEDEIQIDVLKSTSSDIIVKGKYINISIDEVEKGFKLIGKTKYGSMEYDESEVTIQKHIKDNEQLEIEVVSKDLGRDFVTINVSGYEMKLTID